MAAELYDEKAQVLAGALMMLRATDSDGSTSSAEHARELIGETITAHTRAALTKSRRFHRV